MKYTIFFLFGLFICLQGYTQTLTVRDMKTHKGIENVFVYSSHHSGQTNSRGEINLKDFKRAEWLILQHPSFKNEKLTMEELRNRNYTIELELSMLSIGEVMVAANRWEQNLREVPASILPLTKDEIHFNNPQTSADLLTSTGQVFVQKSQLGGGSPMIRGFAANRVLIVVDGVRMNNAIYRSGNLQNVISIDPSSLSGTEVVLGPGSVIYGSDALGGVMDFHTLKPLLSTSDKVMVSGKLMGRYSTANKEKTSHFDLNIGGSKWAYVGSLSYSDFDDLKMGEHGPDEYLRNHYVRVGAQGDEMVDNKDPKVQKYSGYNQLNVLQKVRFRPNSNLNLQYAFHYSETSNVPRYDRLIQYKGDELMYGEWFYGPQKWQMHTMSATLSKPIVLYDHASLVAAFQDYEESRHDRKFGKDELRERTENVKVYSFNADFEKRFDENDILYYGGEWTHNDLDSKGHKRNIQTDDINPIGSRYPDGSQYSSMAFYTNYKKVFSEKLTLNGGFRYSWIKIDAQLDPTFYDFPFENLDLTTGALNGCLGMVYHPEPSWEVKMNASSGYRAPNIDDIGKVFDSAPGKVVVPNNDLDPEFAYNLDLGIKKNFNDKVILELTGFYTFLKDAMVRRAFSFNGENTLTYDGVLSEVEAIVNADEAKIYGLYFGANVQIYGPLTFRTHMNLTHGEEEGGIPARHVPPMFGSVHLEYLTSKFKTELYTLFNGELKNEDLAPSEKDKPYIYAIDQNGNPYCPGWMTLNFRSTYNVTSKIRMNVALENILNKRYRPYSSGIVAPGRNLILSLEWRI